MSGISTASLLEEERYAEFVELEDVLGNLWKGIRNVVSIEKNELYKGMKLGFYFIMLPGIPVLCHVTGIVQGTGHYLDRVWLANQYFLTPSEDLKQSWVMVKDAKNELLKLKAGREERYFESVSAPIFASPSRNEKLHIFTDTNNTKIGTCISPKFVMADTGFHYRINNGEKMFIQSVFLLFSDDYLPHDALKDLDNVKFDPEELDL
ncbi:MAG: hypothetical protein GX754_04665 [Clostridiaceae bacterium]|nr:hypothetical protein [Clostridiaceae bacterium]